MKVKQESFHAHFANGGEGDWKVRSTDQSDRIEDLSKEE